MVYPRDLLKTLEEQLKFKEIVVLTGMRRVGKTTLYRLIFENIESQNKVFLDIENPLNQKIFEEEDYNNIWANLLPHGVSTKERAYIFLDEIQAMPKIVKAVKYLYDHYNVKFFLTGSSSFYLKNLFPESLAGRKLIFELFPLNFREFLIFKNYSKSRHYKNFSEKDKHKNLISYERAKKLYDEYLEFGGFPQVVLEENIAQKKLQLGDVFKTYFEKDVKTLADFRKINAFRDLILLLMQRAGAKLDITKLASEVGVSRKTVYSYLSFLEGTYFIFLLSPFTRNVDREISGSKKIYLCDTGILNHLAKVSGGSLFENAVFNNLRKYGKLNYYQKRSGAEIDFIVDQHTGIEIKTSGNRRDLARLQKISKSLKLKESYVVTRTFNETAGFIPAMEL